MEGSLGGGVVRLGVIVDLGSDAYAQLEAEGWVLHGCPDGTAGAWSARELPETGPIRIVLASGEPRKIAGLFGVLCGMIGQGRQETLAIVHPLFDEATPAVVEAWLRSARPDFPVSIESAE